MRHTALPAILAILASLACALPCRAAEPGPPEHPRQQGGHRAHGELFRFSAGQPPAKSQRRGAVQRRAGMLPAGPEQPADEPMQAMDREAPHPIAGLDQHHAGAGAGLGAAIDIAGMVARHQPEDTPCSASA